MSSKQIIDVEEIKFNERSFLLRICGLFDRTKSALEGRDFAVAQGALRAIFNSLGGFIYDTQYLTQERKKELKELNDAVYKTREDLVNQVEVGRKDLGVVVKENKVYQKLDDIKENLEKCVDEWYEF